MITPEQLARAGTEHAEQMALFCWANMAISMGTSSKWSLLKWMYAIPNGGQRHITVASKLKAEGVKAGVADIFLPYPTKHWTAWGQSNAKQYHGLYVEMKRKDASPSDWKVDQREFCMAVEANGYAYFVAYGYLDAIRIIESYLNVDPLHRLDNGRLR